MIIDSDKCCSSTLQAAVFECARRRALFFFLLLCNRGKAHLVVSCISVNIFFTGLKEGLMFWCVTEWFWDFCDSKPCARTLKQGGGLKPDLPAALKLLLRTFWTYRKYCEGKRKSIWYEQKKLGRLWLLEWGDFYLEWNAECTTGKCGLRWTERSETMKDAMLKWRLSFGF